jgi:hypothetical protein
MREREREMWPINGHKGWTGKICSDSEDHTSAKRSPTERLPIVASS